MCPSRLPRNPWLLAPAWCGHSARIEWNEFLAKVSVVVPTSEI